MTSYVRLRADPKQVRVAIRRVGEKWLVTVKNLATGQQVSRTHGTPRTATMQALKCAEREEMPGIDLGMGWAYDHPQQVVEHQTDRPYTRVERNADKPHRCPKCHSIPPEARKDRRASRGKEYECEPCRVSWLG